MSSTHRVARGSKPAQMMRVTIPRLENVLAQKISFSDLALSCLVHPMYSTPDVIQRLDRARGLQYPTNDSVFKTLMMTGN